MVGSFILISGIILFTDEIIARIDMPGDEIEDISKDPEGTVRVKEGKYIIGEEIKEGQYNITFQKDSGGLTLMNLYEAGDLRDYTAFGNNKKFRLYLKEGDGIDISGIAILTPTTNEKRKYEKVEITSGYWTVGETIAPGKYGVEDIKNPGYMKIVDKAGQYKQDEVIS